MPLSDLLRLADLALSGNAGPDLPEEVLRALVEETGSRAGVLMRGDRDIARWPRTLTVPAEDAGDGWSHVPFAGIDESWELRLLRLDRLEEESLAATRLGLNAWQLREELKRTRFDERFHLWELEAIRSIATGIGGILDTSALADELISHLVALLGVRSAHLYLGSSPDSLRDAGGFGPQQLDDEAIETAWQQGIYTDDLVAVPLQSNSGPLGVLAAAEKEARSGTEPFAPNDVRLLELFAVQVTVALEYVRLTHESLERERLRREIEVAAAIQSHLHPQALPEFEGFRIAVSSSSSLQVAGDTYDVLLRNDSLIATVTDVSGKGVGAGLIAAGVHAGVRLIADDTSELADLAKTVNSYLSGATADNRFATFAMARINRDGTLKAVNAGHLPVFIRRVDGTVEDINSSGLPLGILEMARYEDEEAWLEPGDLLFLYTDGITEAEDPQDEEFGVDRLRDVVSGLEGASAHEACEKILAEVEAHIEGASMQDDATLLVVERLRDNDRQATE
jgi:sigma-B regulation protein RsbU (phosphoserine phosphatase)